MAGVLASVVPLKDKPKNYFRVIKFGLQVAGVNLDGNDSTLYRIYSIFVFIFMCVLYLILDFLETFKHEFTVVANILTYLVPFTLATVKAIVVLLNRKKFGNLLDKLEQEPFTANSNRGGDEEEKLIRECVWICNVQACAYWSGAVLSMIASFSVTLFKRLASDDYHDWIFAYAPFTVLNVTYSPNYEISAIYQCLSATYFAIQFGSVDMVTVFTLAHISYQFKMVQVNLRRVKVISYEKMQQESESGSGSSLRQSNLVCEIDNSLIPWKYLKSSLKEVVQYHLAVINLVEDMESVFSGLLLTIFLTNLGVICFMVYHTSLISAEDPAMLRLLAEILVMCLQIALICYWGEQVLLESQEVGRAAFESNFVGADIRFQKALILIIRRSQNGSQLTAGKFTGVRLTTFVWVMRASYSAFMMLRKQHE